MNVCDNDSRELALRLLNWYGTHKRDLPWRRMQTDPYAVWVSEIMLQQTQVRTVIPYFERWMERFPTVEALANAETEEMLRVWAGLGYYARARNLQRAAQIVLKKHGGRIPSEVSALSDLPGVGRYTVGAIRSIAFNQPAPIVDANVARVLSRVYALDGDPKSAANQSRLWSLSEELIPKGNARDFNQSLMEMGALVCTTADPSCERCPILRFCTAGKSHDPTAWPQIPPGRRTVREVHSSAVVLRGGDVLITRRPPHGLWGGLWELPRRVCEPGETPAACAARAAREVAGVIGQPAESVGQVKHNVTHHSITLHGVRLVDTAGEPMPIDCAEVRWVALDRASNLPLAAPQNQLLKRIIERLDSAARQPELPLTLGV